MTEIKKRDTIEIKKKKKSYQKKPNIFDNRMNKGTYKTSISLLGPKKVNPKIEDDRIRILTIGGFEEVGKNMMAVESKDSIYIFDAGFEFATDEEAPGIDYTLPNIQHLKENKHKIKALIITHGHLDHIGAIPFLMEELGNPPIYCRKLTSLLIKKRMEEFPNIPEIKIFVVDFKDNLKIGELSFEFFEVTHSIPDSMGISIKTKFGNIVITGDLKLTHTDGEPSEKEKSVWGKIASEKNVVLISDSTNCENRGWSVQESTVLKNIENLIKTAPSRIIIATFASQFERMMAFMRIAEKLGKKIVLEGRSVKTNMEIAKKAEYYTPQKHTIIKASDVDQYPSDKIVIVCTGGQGEEYAALPRIARKEHKFIKLNNRDTIILSSSIIPGNEPTVRSLKDKLMRHDVNLIHYKTAEVHSTGHGNSEELAWIIRQVKPAFFIPAYGYHSMLKEHRKIAIDNGNMNPEQIIVPDNGSVIEITSPEKAKILPIKIPAYSLYVDGYSVSNMKKAVISDRKLLAKDGFLNIIVLINIKKKRLQKSPDILSRGFVYLKESQGLLTETRNIINRLSETEIKLTDGGKINVERLKEKIHQKLEAFFIQKTNKKPIIIPVVLVV